MWRESFAVAGTLDDDLVAGVGQTVQGTVAQDRIVEQAEPFIDGPVAGDDEAGRPMTVEDEFVEIGCDCRVMSRWSPRSSGWGDRTSGMTARCGCPLWPGPRF